MSSTTAPRVWLITGTSSGLGRLLVETALRDGEKVVATLRKPHVLSDLQKQYPEDRLLVLQLDVTKREEVKHVFKKAFHHFGRIDVVYNNAGVAFVAEVEASKEEDARQLFDTNFWGAWYVSVEAVKYFREENKPAGGRLVQNSSMLGTAPSPVCGFYNAAKFAFDGMTYTLNSELDPAWNIEIIILAYGWYRTHMQSHNAPLYPDHDAYDNAALAPKQVRTAFALMQKGQDEILGDPAEAIRVTYDLLKLPKGELPLIIPLGNDAVAGFRGRIKELEAAVEKGAVWSKEIKAPTKPSA